MMPFFLKKKTKCIRLATRQSPKQEFFSSGARISSLAGEIRAPLKRPARAWEAI